MSTSHTLIHLGSLIPEFPPGVVPITPQSSTFTHEKHQIKRQQFPFCPAKALTIHSLQGKTLSNKCLLSISKTIKKAELYVALSRVKRLQDIIFITPFPESVLHTKWDANLVEHESHLTELAQMQ